METGKEGIDDEETRRRGDEETRKTRKTDWMLELTLEAQGHKGLQGDTSRPKVGGEEGVRPGALHRPHAWNRRSRNVSYDSQLYPELDVTQLSRVFCR